MTSKREIIKELNAHQAKLESYVKPLYFYALGLTYALGSTKDNENMRNKMFTSCIEAAAYLQLSSVKGQKSKTIIKRCEAIRSMIHDLTTLLVNAQLINTTLRIYNKCHVCTKKLKSPDGIAILPCGHFICEICHDANKHAHCTVCDRYFFIYLIIPCPLMKVTVEDACKPEFIDKYGTLDELIANQKNIPAINVLKPQ